MIILLVGLLISFLGQLPFSNMNLTATQMSVQEGFKNAWQFGLGIALVEVIYLRFSLTGMSWVIQHALFFTILGWLTIVLFFTLGVISLMASRKQAGDKKSILLNNKVNRFLLGMSISAINPLQIPFWFTWGISLVKGNVLHPNNTDYNLFTIGAGLGTLTGISVYIYGGRWAITKLKTNNKAINRFMGFVFIAVALWQLYKIIFDPWTKKNV